MFCCYHYQLYLFAGTGVVFLLGLVPVLVLLQPASVAGDGTTILLQRVMGEATTGAGFASSRRR